MGWKIPTCCLVNDLRQLKHVDVHRDECKMQITLRQFVLGWSGCSALVPKLLVLFKQVKSVCYG